MKLIATMPDEALEVVSTTEDKEMQIEYNGIQFKDLLKLIISPLTSIIAQILGGHLDLYVHTKAQLREYCKERGKQWSDEYIDLLIRKEPIFYSLIKSYDSLSNTLIPSREQYIANTSETPHWTHSVLISCTTSQHHKWPIHSSWKWRWRAIMVRMHWRHWVRSGLSTSYESIQMKSWRRRIWRRSSWFTWVNSMRARTFDWWRRMKSMTPFDYWRTFEDRSLRSWNDMLRSTLVKAGRQLRAVRASIILMQTTCMEESFIEWCPMSWWVCLRENRWWRRSIEIRSNGFNHSTHLTNMDTSSSVISKHPHNSMTSSMTFHSFFSIQKAGM